MFNGVLQATLDGTFQIIEEFGEAEKSIECEAIGNDLTHAVDEGRSQLMSAQGDMERVLDEALTIVELADESVRAAFRQ